MLRLLVLLLLLANAGFFAWQAGWLEPVLGDTATSGREPQRLKAQVHQDKLIVLPQAVTAPQTTADAADSLGADGVTAEAMTEGASAAALAESTASSASAAAAASATTSSSAPTTDPLLAAQTPRTGCMEAGPFTPDEDRSIQATLLRAMPAKGWSTERVSVPGLWLVYMGPYPDADNLLRKQAELRRIKNVTFEEVRSPAHLSMGLSLGRFNAEDQANAVLESMKLRGVRTARVVSARPAMEVTVIKVDQASPALQQKLSALPLPVGRGFAPCVALP